MFHSVLLIVRKANKIHGDLLDSTDGSMGVAEKRIFLQGFGPD